MDYVVLLSAILVILSLVALVWVNWWYKKDHQLALRDLEKVRNNFPNPKVKHQKARDWLLVAEIALLNLGQLTLISNIRTTLYFLTLDKLDQQLLALDFRIDAIAALRDAAFRLRRQPSADVERFKIKARVCQFCALVLESLEE